MMSKALSLVVSLALFLPQSHCVEALELSKHPSDGDGENIIMAKGSIDLDDAFRLQAYLAKLPTKPRTSLYISSSGGSIQGAIALGREIYKSKIRTYVAGADICMSACPIAFLAGRDSETGGPYRVKATSARVGFHKFTPDLPERTFNKKDAHEIQLRAQKTIFDIAVYFDEVGVDLDVLSFMLRQKEIYTLQNHEAINLGIHVQDAKTGELVRAKGSSR